MEHNGELIMAVFSHKRKAKAINPKEEPKPHLFLVIRVMQAMVFLFGHGLLHLFGERRAVAVLERPHALRIKEANTIILVKEVSKIRLKAGHGTQLSVDERDPPFLCWHSQPCQQISESASFGKQDLSMGETSVPFGTPIACQSPIEPSVHSYKADHRIVSFHHSGTEDTEKSSFVCPENYSGQTKSF
jgi:hypothetical protein